MTPDKGWLPIVLCPTDGVNRMLLLADGREVIGSFSDGGLGQASGWQTATALEHDVPVYEEVLRGGFMAWGEPRWSLPEPERKQIGTRKQTMWLIGRLPDGVYPTHFRPNDTLWGKPDA